MLASQERESTNKGMNHPLPEGSRYPNLQVYVVSVLGSAVMAQCAFLIRGSRRCRPQIRRSRAGVALGDTRFSPRPAPPEGTSLDESLCSTPLHWAALHHTLDK